MDFFDEIRQKVAIEHNVLLGKDDPILVTVTINEMVLGRYLELAANSYENANRELTIALEQQLQQSKEVSGRVITDAANYSASQINAAVDRAISEAGIKLQQQIADAQTAGRQAAVSSSDAQTAKNGALTAAILSGVAALVAVAALVIVLVK